MKISKDAVARRVLPAQLLSVSDNTTGYRIAPAVMRYPLPDGTLFYHCTCHQNAHSPARAGGTGPAYIGQECRHIKAARKAFPTWADGEAAYPRRLSRSEQ